ncbi:MAG: hypothetical protein MK052_11925 [Alphaproteobacteria bacterium]|nr:hypothetical protein [Alphaproteobacteria bacterium]
MDLNGFKNNVQSLGSFGVSAAVIDQALASNLYGGVNGPADAYRHILVAAELLRIFPSAIADIYLKAHEFGGGSNSTMDDWNNAIGSDLGIWLKNNNKTWVDTVSYAREIMEKSLDGYSPSDFQTETATWNLNLGNIYKHPVHSIIILSSGLQVNSIVLAEQSTWSVNYGNNWPDEQGDWISNFDGSSYNYILENWITSESNNANDMPPSFQNETNIAFGYEGSDTLIGGYNLDYLDGGAGDDILVAGGVGTNLYGGTGADEFHVANGTYVMDGAGEDSSFWGGLPLTGGISQWWNEAGSAYYAGFGGVLAGVPGVFSGVAGAYATLLDLPAAGTFRYVLGESGELAVQVGRGNFLEAYIKDYDYLEGSAGITAFRQFSGNYSLADNMEYIKLALAAAGIEAVGTDPLVIDLDGDGLELSRMGAHNSVYYDFDGNGFAENMGWVKPNDGFLVRDHNSNGSIEAGDLFGDATTNGFAQLAAYDSNSDNVIDASDAEWNTLAVWQACKPYFATCTVA